MPDSFDELIKKFSEVVTIIECPLLKNTGDYGLFVQRDGLPFILIEHNQPEIDKRVILVEEFKHFLYTFGITLNQNDPRNRKQENYARVQTYKELVTVDDLFRCYQQGLTNEYQIAEELDLPQEFLHNAIEYFKSIGLNCVTKNGYYMKIGDTIEFHRAV